MNLTTVTGAVSKIAKRPGLLIQKHSPEILMVAGVAGIVGTVILACRATLKVDEVLDKKEDTLYKLDYAKAHPEELSEPYSDDDYKKDVTVTYVNTTIDFIKLYGPTVLLGVASIGCLIGSHRILQKRNLALAAAFEGVAKSFDAYRKRVVEELGEDKDYEFKHGLKAEQVTKTEVDEEGKTHKVKGTEYSVDPDKVGMYAKYFDEGVSAAWSPDDGYNQMYLKTQQTYINDMLKARGHVFLNDVYDRLGIPRTPEGQVVGWVKDGDDGYIDFGFMKDQEFVNGHKKSVLLDFNVDGVVYNLI